MIVSSYKSNLTEDFSRANIGSMSNNVRDNYYNSLYCSGEFKTESQPKRKKKTNVRQKIAESSKYSAGQLVYVKKYNQRSGKFQIYNGEIISSIDKGFGAISYTWLALSMGKTYKAWEEDIYSSYSEARAAVDSKDLFKEVNESKKEDSQHNDAAYDNSQDVKYMNDKVEVVSVSTKDGAIKLRRADGVERDEYAIVNDIDAAKSDITATNTRCSDIEQRVNHLEKELTKEKKKRNKLVRLGIACLLGG